MKRSLILLGCILNVAGTLLLVAMPMKAGWQEACGFTSVLTGLIFLREGTTSRPLFARPTSRLTALSTPARKNVHLLVIAVALCFSAFIILFFGDEQYFGYDREQSSTVVWIVVALLLFASFVLYKFVQIVLAALPPRDLR